MEVIVNKGQVRSVEDRRRRDQIGEKLESLRRSSVDQQKQTGKVSGPFRVRDWEKS